MPFVTNSGRGLLDYLFSPDSQPFSDDSLRDRWSQNVGQAAGILGFDPQRTASTTRRVIDAVPLVGDTLSFDDARRDYQAGNYGSAALNAGTGLLGVFPGGGDTAALAGKGLLHAIFAGVGAKTADKGLLAMDAVAPKAQGLLDGIRAYHGSPHSFDKFSLDKIGTGEGAQAYGHGLYFAEAEDTARSYRDALSNTLATDAGRISHGDADYAIMEAGRTVGGVSQRQLDTLSTNIVEALRNDMDPADVVSTLAKTDQERVAANAMIEAAKQYRKGDPGHMYEVNINANPDDFLDWDKPLSEQGPKVQDGLRKLWGSSYERRIADPYNSHGQDLAARTMDPVNGRAYTQELRQAGIPGIKYLDAGSRGNVNTNDIRGSLSMWEKALAKTPNDPYAQQQVDGLRRQLQQAEAGASRNYVVFDENLISIVKKYGLAGAVSMGLISQQMAEQMEDQGAI